jgi:hypothetical protein
LQLKCNELKRARLADDLNEKLAKRPGPLELVESGILVSSDAKLADAIKQIQYPRTSTILNQSNLGNQPPGFARHHPYRRDSYTFSNVTDDFSGFNFNFSNLTDDQNEDSNASHTSSSTSKTLNSISSSSVTSFNFSNLNGPNLNCGLQSGDLVNYVDTASPASSTASMPKTSSSQNLVDLNAVGQAKLSGNKSTVSKKKTFSSASSTTSSQSFRTIKSSSNINPPSSGQATGRKLIFHEYKGPNQKSSKTSLNIVGPSGSKGSTSKAIKTKSSSFSSNTNNNQNLAAGNNPGGIFSNNQIMNSGGAAGMNLLDTVNMNPGSNEIYINTFDNENSNDSMSCFNKQLDEQDAYRIRLEQQKILLRLTGTVDDQDNDNKGL